MAASLGRICRSSLLKPNNGTIFNQVSNFSTIRDWSRGRKVLTACLGMAAGGIGALIYALDLSVKADDAAHAPSYPWEFETILGTFDHASARRGWEVFKNVCSACHSLEYVAYRHLVNVTHTEAEAKAIAAEAQVKDGPDESGNYYMRPGKLSDTIPSPYPNEEAARAANNGAAPPDLSLITNARHNGTNYLFSLLTGYMDPPAGITIGEGQSYNPYFPGGAISMAQAIYDEVVDYEDGTPATASQIAKDVTTFLMWSSNKEIEDRKRMLIKVFGIFTILVAASYYHKRRVWTTIKSAKIAFVPRKK